MIASTYPSIERATSSETVNGNSPDLSILLPLALTTVEAIIPLSGGLYQLTRR